MIENLPSIMPMLNLGIPDSLPTILAQTEMTNYFQELGQDITGFIPTIIAAIVILIVGIIVAYIAKAIIKGILNRTEIDNKIAGWISGHPEDAPKIENWIAGAVFWIIIILTVVAVLQTLQLDAVTEPINDFLGGVIGFLPNIVGALILLGVAWLLAVIVKLVTVRALKAFGLDERLGQQFEDSSDTETSETTTTEGQRQNQFSLSETIGNALYWFVFLLFLPSILSTLGLEGTLAPVQELLNEILAIIPNILAAIIIGFAGWVVAQVVRRIVTNLLAAAGTDSLGSRFGFTQRTGPQSLSWLIGTIVFVLILIPTAIAALNALEIAAIAVPAIAMLNEILNILPDIFAAAVVLSLAYIVGKLISELVTSILTGVGFNRVFQWLGLPTRPSSAAPPTPPPAQEPEVEGATTARPVTPSPTRSPSELVGIIVWVGIMLFATLAAVNILGIEALTLLVNGIIIVSGRILAGLIVFAIGLYFANLAFNLILSSGSRQSRTLAHAARIVIIAFVTAMALEQIGIASDIVSLAFGLLLGSIAVAIALAFGLGSRDVAGEQVREWLDSFKQKQ